MTAPTILERWLWPAAGLAVALLLALTPAFATLDRAWQDTVLRWLARDQPARATLIVDIDEGSMQALRSRAGSWPYARDVHAAVAQKLFSLGARAVVFNLVFADARQGDDALQRVAAEQASRLVFGADLRRDPISADGGPAGRLLDAGWTVPETLPTANWASWVPPSAALLPAAPRIGVLQARLDEDGRLRCAGLLHRVDRLVLPSLVLAALTAGDPLPEVALDDDGGSLHVGHHHWPIDRQGCVTPRLLRRADALPVLSFAALALGALPAELAAQVHGRTVFVGSPSALDARALTPLGQVGGTVWQALAHEALATGDVVRPRSAAVDAALVLLALVPAVLGAWRRPPALGRDLVEAGVASGLALLLAAGLLALWVQPSALPLALLVLACGLLAAMGRWQRWLGLQRLQAQVERSHADATSRARAEFMAHMSHEIRTPLNAVLGVAQLLKDTPLTPVQRRYVAVFNQAGAHLRQLVDDVLDLSRAESDRLPIHREGFSLSRLTDELEALFESRTQAKSLRFTIAVDATLPDVVFGDRHRLQQVLVNLLGNACKFTETGSVDLQVRRGAAADEMEFVVRDTGVGIPADMLDAVFEPFTQADAGVARRFGGSGLGLTITRRLVQAMGGQVSISSREGDGTEISVRLPLPGWDGDLPSHETAAPAPPPILAGRRVLLAEDNDYNLLVVEGMLEGSGVTIDVARDGLIAVGKAAQAQYDVILMDLQMPRLDGLAATRAIRHAEQASARPPVPIVALSANAHLADVEASRAAGCNAHLGKPFDKAELLNLLAEQCARSAPALPAAPAGFDASDVAAARERFGGDDDLYTRVLDTARVQWRDFAADYGRCAEAGDDNGCRRLAHDLKSGAATVGARRLAEAAERLETVIREGGDRLAARLQVQAALDELLP